VTPTLPCLLSLIHQALVSGLRFHCDSSFFLLFPPPTLRARWIKLNGNWLCAWKCNLKMHARNLGYIPSSYKSGAQKPCFSTTSQLNSKFNSLYLLNETWYRLSGHTRGLLHRLKWHELWSTNGFKLDSHFYPPYVKSAFYSLPGFATHRGQQTNSTKLCQMADSKPC